jgi:hypothetical protein
MNMQAFTRVGYRPVLHQAVRQRQAPGVGDISMPDSRSLVFVVDDDVSVRESLELLIRYEGWQPSFVPSRLRCKEGRHWRSRYPATP